MFSPITIVENPTLEEICIWNINQKTGFECYRRSSINHVVKILGIFDPLPLHPCPTQNSVYQASHCM